MATFTTGKAGFFSVDDTGGTVRDLSDTLNQIDFPQTVDTGETTSFGAGTKSFIAALSSATISITGTWDPTVDGYLAGGSEPASRSFVYAPVKGSTAIGYKGECIMTAYSGATPVGDTVTYTASFQVTGTITREAQG